jgi:hypothetical protein
MTWTYTMMTGLPDGTQHLSSIQIFGLGRLMQRMLWNKLAILLMLVPILG